jgi:diguanylate cyclase (GGDEF)-like protein
VKPHIYETNGFLAVVAVVLLGVAGAGYQVRVRAPKAEEARLTALVAERTAELENVNAQLQQLATEDGLTGLANRRRFDDFLRDEWQRSRRSNSPVSLLLMDVDDFKKYNDSLGHPAGDACLQSVAGTLHRAVRRGTDLAARHGGEEFAVVLSNTDATGARILAESIRAAVEELELPHPASRVGPNVTASIGCATMVADEKNQATELVAAADAALYRSKENGRNRVTG